MENYKDVNACYSSLANDVLAQLKRKHCVFVSGDCEETYTKIAFAAVAKMNFPFERCLRIDSPADWRYVVRWDTDLVFFLHPFGKDNFEMEKASLMSDLQDSILHPVTENDNSHNVNVVIVTDHSILNEYNSYFDNEIVADPIKVYLHTSEDSPVDLTKGGAQFNLQYSRNDQYSDFVAQTNCLMKFKTENMTEENRCLLQSNLRKAKDIFKINKSLVIIGKQKCGKTYLALALLQAYDESHYLILTEPDETKFIRLGETCVAVIEDFTGKQIYEPFHIEKLFRTFDVLLAAVKNGQLNVITTSDKTRFSRCYSEFQSHPLLYHVMTLKTKQSCEPSSPPPPPPEPRIIQNVKAHYKLNRWGEAKGYLKEEALKGNKIHGISYNGDGTFLVGNSRTLSLIRSDLSKYAEFSNVNCRMKIIISSSSNAFFTIGSKIIMYEINDRECSYNSAIKLEDRALSASSFRNKIFIIDRTGKLSVFSDRLQFERMSNIPLVKKEEMLSSRVYIVASDEVIFLLKSYVYCIYLKENMIRYFSDDKFVPLSMCRCDEFSIFVFGKSQVLNKSEFKIFQLNAKMEILSKIVLKDKTSGQISLSDFTNGI